MPHSAWRSPQPITLPAGDLPKAAFFGIAHNASSKQFSRWQDAFVHRLAVIHNERVCHCCTRCFCCTWGTSASNGASNGALADCRGHIVEVGLARVTVSAKIRDGDVPARGFRREPATEPAHR